MTDSTEKETSTLTQIMHNLFHRQVAVDIPSRSYLATHGLSSVLNIANNIMYLQMDITSLKKTCRCKFIQNNAPSHKIGQSHVHFLRGQEHHITASN